MVTTVDPVKWPPMTQIAQMNSSIRAIREICGDERTVAFGSAGLRTALVGRI
jgi:hypothetical protein